MIARLLRPLVCCSIAVLALSGCKANGDGGPAAPSSPDPSAKHSPGPSTDPSAKHSLDFELDQAAAGVEDSELAALLREHWRDRLEHAPSFAMSIGVHDFDDRWPERGPVARAAARERRLSYLARATEITERGGLHDDDDLTLELFVTELESAEARQACELWAWSVSTRSNALSDIAGVAELARLHVEDDDESSAALLQRYRAFPGLVDDRVDDLRDGLARGLVADAQTLGRTVEMIERQLATAIDESNLLEPAAELPSQDPRRAELRRIVADEVRPALQRYVAVLRDELLPAARTGAQVGVGALPSGPACYAALILHHTSEARSAQELHELGLAEIARIDAEFRELGERALGTAKLDEVLRRLREDPDLHFRDAEEVESFARESLRAAEAAAPKWFGHLPTTPCEVRAIPDYEAPYTTIAYYRQPGDGEPGVYFINTHAPTTRPRYEARVLAIHEAVPGHHTQIAIAQELADAPAFRRHGGTTVFVEGWALYTERLADEMGLYESDLDRLGVLSFDAWRASRLVVDTGIHAQGWTREQAVEFMVAHTALAKNNIINEVDRYVGWPGQALAYKYGQVELLRLRADAEASLGDRFDIAGFHDLVLGAGPVTLPILRRRVGAWVERGG